MTIRPYPPGPQPLKITSPSAAACIEVPLGATISIPSCRRVASCSKPRETSPCTGQIRAILSRNASLVATVIGEILADEVSCDDSRIAVTDCEPDNSNIDSVSTG